MLAQALPEVRLVFPANAIVTALAYVPVVLAGLGLTSAAFDEKQAGSFARGASIALLVSAVTSLLSRVATAVLYVVPGPHDLARAAFDLGSLGLLVGLVAVLAEARAARVPVFAALAAAAIGELLDLIVANNLEIGTTAQQLGITTGALSKLILHDDQVGRAVNDLRRAKGMRPLR